MVIVSGNVTSRHNFAGSWIHGSLLISPERRRIAEASGRGIAIFNERALVSVSLSRRRSSSPLALPDAPLQASRYGGGNASAFRCALRFDRLCLISSSRSCSGARRRAFFPRLRRRAFWLQPEDELLSGLLTSGDFPSRLWRYLRYGGGRLRRTGAILSPRATGLPQAHDDALPIPADRASRPCARLSVPARAYKPRPRRDLSAPAATTERLVFFNGLRAVLLPPRRAAAGTGRLRSAQTRTAPASLMLELVLLVSTTTARKASTRQFLARFPAPRPPLSVRSLRRNAQSPCHRPIRIAHSQLSAASSSPATAASIARSSGIRPGNGRAQPCAFAPPRPVRDARRPYVSHAVPTPKPNPASKACRHG